MSTIADVVKLDESALNELEASFGGQLVRPGDPGYDEHRKVWNGSIDRLPGADRALRRRGRRHRRREVRQGDRPPGRGARRRAQLPRPLGLRRRHRHRPGADEGHPGRPGRRARRGPRRACCWGSSTARRRQFGLAAPAGIVTHTGHRRADARRRHRLADAQARADDRPAPRRWTWSPPTASS